MIVFLKMSIAKSPNHLNQWIIWNVGQGQWMTQIENDSCTHFDFGGEIFMLSKIKPLYIQKCRNKTNKLYLSHAHWDHYAFYNFILKNNIKTCWDSKPQEELKGIKQQISYCNEPTKQNNIQILFYDQTAKKCNDRSIVLKTNEFLIPGDSPSRKEKKWALNIGPTNQIKYLILGHHGSRTSTGELLLGKLPNLKMAFVSSRFKKYGHPHKDVLQRLHKHHINAIRTESWGSILIL